MTTHDDLTIALIHVKGAAKLLCMSVHALRKRIANREVPFVRIGRRIYFDRSDLRDWIEDRKVPPERKG